MRFALIIADQPCLIAGRPLALRQLDFAVAAGAERIVAMGHAAPALMTDLRHRAETAGARFQPVAGPHALLGLLSTADDLLVMMPGLLPESQEAVEILRGQPAILTLPAPAGLASGFERIDADHAWAGVLAMPGNLLERLAQLPEDADAASALLRIALQGRVPLRQLQGQSVGGPDWCRVTGDGTALQAAWMKRHEADLQRGDLSGELARVALRRFGPDMMAGGRAGAAPLALLGLSILMAILLAAWGQGARGWSMTALLLLGVAAPCAKLAVTVDRLKSPAFVRHSRASGMARKLPWVVDGGLLAVMILAGTDDGAWRIYPPVVLILTLHAGRQMPLNGLGAWLSDRVAIVALLAMAALAGQFVAGVMLIAVIFLALIVAYGPGRDAGEFG